MLNKTLCVRIISTDKDLKIYEVESIDENLENKILVIPFERFYAKNDGSVESRSASRNLGLITYARVISERDNTMILDRQVIVEEKSKEFKNTYKPGDKITCQYHNSVFKGKKLEGIYVLFDKTVKGYILQKSLKDKDKKYKLNEEIEGYIDTINSKNQFMLTQLEVNKKGDKILKEKEIYLGKLISINKETYIFECLGKKVIVARSLELELNSYSRIFINKSVSKKNIKIYYGLISG